MKIRFTTSALFTLLLSCSPLLNAAESTIDLFASGDFSQWKQVDGNPVDKGWQIKNGIVICEGLHHSDIITNSQYKDFELTFEWNISEGGNSGIKYLTKGNLGLEYQVLDDDNHVDGEKPTHRSGALYDLVPAPDDKPIQPVGQWNTGKIVVRNNVVQHWLNGKKLLQIKIGSKNWIKRFENSKYRKYEGFGTWTGPILLQDHGNMVWFRNVKIKRL